jgi:glycosyltransferase involved in cell wall biosynthesis
MIRIVFLTTGLQTGGAEAMLLKLLENIDRKWFEPYVITLISRGEIGSRIEKLGIPVYAMGMNRLGLSLFPLARLFKTLRQIRPDIVQTWMYHADLLGGVVARLAGITKVVWALRNSNLSAKLTKNSTIQVVKICAAISTWLPIQILSCSKRAGEIHAELGYCRDKIKIIPNGFDLGSFQPNSEARESVRKELGLPYDAFLVGLMARYDSQKNHAGFISAAAQVRRSMPCVHFVLAGMGVDKTNEALTKLIAEHDLKNHIHPLGQRSDMPRLMASLDVLASTSSFGEAFPNVLGEAMACGVPCVVTDVGDSAEIVDDTGRVVQSGDMEVLARHVQELLCMTEEDKERMGQKARARVEANYEIGHVTRLYEEFYERIANKMKSCVE